MGAEVDDLDTASALQMGAQAPERSGCFSAADGGGGLGPGRSG